MNAKSETYRRHRDETGEEYYCPIGAIAENGTASERLDDCVEAATVGRYPGNIVVVDHSDA